MLCLEPKRNHSIAATGRFPCPKLSRGQGQHCFGSKASRSPSFSAEAWNKRPPVPKAYRYLASGIDRHGSTLLPPGFLAKTSGCPRPFFTNKTPGKLRKRTTGLSSHASYRSPGHGPFWVFTQNYSGPSDNQRNNAQSRRCFTVMRRRIRATKFGIAASSCTSTAVCESKEYGKV